ncbi:MAG TPA: UDP-2,4-diacetamido-2,4,6-trideoxy-beta-L-altropyranose hydrolase [Dehalococcoidia bacterium]|nr:UDP-2,4-diacetamido-2,4,6-trideoxy-beta-L-altropyranose hydrolase [Dehalococcoidia bacterium]
MKQRIRPQKDSHRGSVLIRTDSSIGIGTGHVMRCLTLADALKSVGIEVLFVCRKQVGHLAELIESRGHEVRLLQAPESEHNDKHEHKPLSEIDQQKDAEETIQALHGLKPGWIVVDHYGLDALWHRSLRMIARKILVIDDLANRALDCDVLLDQNYYQDPSARYKNFVDTKAICLLGPNYAMLRPEFVQAIDRDHIRVRTKLERILVFLGGADATNETKKAILAMDQLVGHKFEADVIVGAVNPHTSEIKQLCDQRAYTTFYQDVGNIAELMGKADLAIGAGGSTILERCYLKLPSLVMVLAKNQSESVADLARVGALESLGWYANVKIDQIANSLHDFCQHPEKLNVAGQKMELVLSHQNYRGVDGLVEVME